MHVTSVLSWQFEDYREQVERASPIVRARYSDIRIATEWAISKATSSTLVTGNDFRNLSAECRLAVSADRAGPSADIKWKHRGGLSFSSASADPSNICADRYRKGAVCGPALLSLFSAILRDTPPGRRSHTPPSRRDRFLWELMKLKLPIFTTTKNCGVILFSNNF